MESAETKNSSHTPKAKNWTEKADHEKKKIAPKKID